ncbi:MAG: anaerobic ribonucleoside-triphosphate reductase activating protein [Clostridiales bacterium]|nr:anaerobic ribonucleoside-triphosphate reductase activating protein [Clostridiales bacterium]
MKIHGMQKLTLIDYPGKIAATLFLAGCNFRCPFCHNASLVTHIDHDGISDAQVLSFLQTRKGLLDGVCITGGEPLLQKEEELVPFLSAIKELGFSIKLDTNGQQYDMLVSLIERQLIDYVAMDIKNAPAKYPLTVGLPHFNIEEVEKSAKFLINGNFPYEFRTTVVKELHDEQDFHDIGRWLQGAKQYFLQSFVDSGDTLCKGLSAYAKEDLEKFRQIAARYIPTAALREIE